MADYARRLGVFIAGTCLAFTKQKVPARHPYHAKYIVSLQDKLAQILVH